MSWSSARRLSTACVDLYFTLDLILSFFFSVHFSTQICSGVCSISRMPWLDRMLWIHSFLTGVCDSHSSLWYVYPVIWISCFSFSLLSCGHSINDYEPVSRLLWLLLHYHSLIYQEVLFVWCTLFLPVGERKFQDKKTFPGLNHLI